MSQISTLGRFFVSLSLIAGSFASSPNVQAQRAIVTAVVPFAFSANDQQFDAGQYEIRPLNAFELLVSNITTHQNRLLPVSAMGLMKIQPDGRLLFHRYNGNEHYLYQVWIPGRSEFSQLNPTRREQQTMIAAKSASSSGNVVEAVAIPVR
ncbi:hypothetical protein [Tunturiibacter lichenicola]|uniref:hypothetical protein n=1 Tax=Tunturiibacter lichenicola TaxID=2051959 RepID=UPI0021B4B4FA|nr:hypothetical protein [Edaphobacter lichenicola]